MKFQEANPYLRNCHLAILDIIWLSENPKVHYRFHIRLHLVQTCSVYITTLHVSKIYLNIPRLSKYRPSGGLYTSPFSK
jgi:hypothetical protein